MVISKAIDSSWRGWAFPSLEPTKPTEQDSDLSMSYSAECDNGELWGQGSCGCDDCLLTLGHLEMSLPTIRRDLEEHLTCPVTSYIRKLRPRDIEGLLRDGGWVSTWQRQFKVVLVE